MTTTTPSPAPKPQRGFTLVEVLIGSTISVFILAGVISTFLFIGRSTANIVNYSDMESEAREGLEYFAQDTRQASNLIWNSSTSITLTVNGTNIVYAYSSGDGSFSRTEGAGAADVIIDGITSFEFAGYMITGAGVSLADLSTAAKREAASDVTKQVQIYLKANRTSTTVAAATNTVLSARFILRNKRVTS